MRSAIGWSYGAIGDRSGEVALGDPLQAHLATRARPIIVVLVEPWDESAPDVLRLPSGRLVRGRGLRYALPAGPLPQFALYLQGKSPPPGPGEWRWLRWPDWWLPADPVETRQALGDVWRRAESERVEVACSGGQGRTGTALACLAILDGVAPAEAVLYVREHYNSKAVETPRQRRFVARFQRQLGVLRKTTRSGSDTPHKLWSTGWSCAVLTLHLRTSWARAGRGGPAAASVVALTS